MTPFHPLLISVDVGGTLGRATGPGLTMRLVEASPLPPRQAREILRNHLHTQPIITDILMAEVANALHVPQTAFPRDPAPAPLTLFPGTVEALQELSATATVVTLSNVTCADADTEDLRARLAPWVDDYFPSCRIGYAKPDPRAFRSVAERYGVPLTRMVHIGDDWACDVVGAAAAGPRAIWISGDRAVPDQEFVRDQAVLVANDLATAVRHFHHLGTTKDTL